MTVLRWIVELIGEEVATLAPVVLLVGTIVAVEAIAVDLAAAVMAGLVSEVAVADAAEEASTVTVEAVDNRRGSLTVGA